MGLPCCGGSIMAGMLPHAVDMDHIKSSGVLLQIFAKLSAGKERRIAVRREAQHGDTLRLQGCTGTVQTGDRNVMAARGKRLRHSADGSGNAAAFNFNIRKYVENFHKLRFPGTPADTVRVNFQTWGSLSG